MLTMCIELRGKLIFTALFFLQAAIYFFFIKFIYFLDEKLINRINNKQCNGVNQYKPNFCFVRCCDKSELVVIIKILSDKSYKF